MSYLSGGYKFAVVLRCVGVVIIDKLLSFEYISDDINKPIGELKQGPREHTNKIQASCFMFDYCKAQ